MYQIDLNVRFYRQIIESEFSLNCRQYDRESLNQRSPLGSSSHRPRTPWNRGRKNCRKQRAQRTPREPVLLNQHNRTHMDSQEQKQKQQSAIMGHAGDCTRFSMQRLGLLIWCFCVTPSIGQAFFLTLCLLLGLFFSYWVVLSSLNVRAFALYYCILFRSVWLSPLGGLIFSEE